MSDDRAEILATLKAMEDVTPFDIIREVFNLGWQMHSEDLVLHELDKIETKLTHYREVARLLKEGMGMVDYLVEEYDVEIGSLSLMATWRQETTEALAAVEAQDVD